MFWCEKIEEEVLKPTKLRWFWEPECEMSRQWGIPEINWANTVVKRARPHAKHLHSNYLWCLVSVFSLVLVHC